MTTHNAFNYYVMFVELFGHMLGVHIYAADHHKGLFATGIRAQAIRLLKHKIARANRALPERLFRSPGVGEVPGHEG